jgi:hypothetical protein
MNNPKNMADPYKNYIKDNELMDTKFNYFMIGFLIGGIIGIIIMTLVSKT